nr:hypothetical protein [Bacillus pumilus]
MKKEAFAFRFHHSDVTLPRQIWSVGREVQSSSLYRPEWRGAEGSGQVHLSAHTVWTWHD